MMQRSARSIFQVFLSISVLAFACVTSAARADTTLNLDEQLDLFLEWFPGEYDNNEQVWQQMQDGLEGDALHERIHHHFVPVDLPEIGDHVYFVIQTLDDDPSKVYRQRIYRLEKQPEEQAIRLDIFRMTDEERYRDAWLNPAVVADLTMDDLSTREGCEVYWRHNGEYFDGTMKERACFFFSERSGKNIYITDTLRLTEQEIWIGDKAEDADGNYVFGREEPHVNRKVRRFKGWMGVKKVRVDPNYEGDDMFFVGDFSIHSEGGRQSILDDEGNPTGYGIELALLTYQNTRVPILKLGIIDETTGKTINYSWTSTDASRIGINVRWFQAGLTAVEE